MTILRVLCALMLAVLATAAGPPQPLYVLLYAHIDDHIHLDISEDRIARTLALLEKYHESATHARKVSAVIQFSGAMAQVISDRKLKSVSADLIKAAAQRGLVEIGYRAADEPTYSSRGENGYRGGRTIEEWWTARSAIARRLLTEAKEPLSGAPRQGSGGIERTLEVFGAVSCVGDWGRDVGVDTEFVHQLRRLKLSPLAFGLPEPSPLRLLHGYRDEARVLGALLSPDTRFAPELFWQDGVLRLSETSDRNVRVVRGYEGVDAFKKMISELDRSKPHVLRVELAAQEIYLQPEFAKGLLYPPVRFAYDHPDRPALPSEALRPREDVDEAYSKEEGFVRWLANEFLSEHPENRVVSAGELIRRASSATASNLSHSDLMNIAQDLLAKWGDNTVPPNYAQVGTRQLSLSDAFQALAAALGGLHRTDKFPSLAPLLSVYGPEEMSSDLGLNTGEVSVAAVARTSATLADRFSVQRWGPTPTNVIPASVEIEGHRVNAAQYLHLMAQATLAASPTTKLRIKMASMFSPIGEMFPMSGSRSDQGVTWTLKPAVLRP